MVRITNQSQEVRSSFEKQDCGDFSKRYQPKANGGVSKSRKTPDVLKSFPATSKSKSSSSSSRRKTRSDIVDEAIEITNETTSSTSKKSSSSSRRRSKSPTSSRRRSRSPTSSRRRSKSPTSSRRGTKKSTKSKKSSKKTEEDVGNNATERSDRTEATAPLSPESSPVPATDDNTKKSFAAVVPEADAAPRRKSAWELREEAKRRGWENKPAATAPAPLRRMVAKAPSAPRLGRNPGMDSSGHSTSRRRRVTAGSELNASGHRSTSRADQSLNTSDHGPRRRLRATEQETSGAEMNLSGHRTSMDTSGHGRRRMLKSTVTGSSVRKVSSDDKNMDTSSGHGRRRLKSSATTSSSSSKKEEDPKTESDNKSGLRNSSMSRANSMERRRRRRAEKEANSSTDPKSEETKKSDEKETEKSGEALKKGDETTTKDSNDEATNDKPVVSAKDRYRRMLKKQDEEPEEKAKVTPACPETTTPEEKKEDRITKMIKEDTDSAKKEKKIPRDSKKDSQEEDKSKDDASKQKPATTGDESEGVSKEEPKKKELNNEVDAMGYLSHLRSKRQSRSSLNNREQRKTSLRESLTNKPAGCLPPAFAEINDTFRDVRSKRTSTTTTTPRTSTTSSSSPKVSPPQTPKTPARTPAWKLREQNKHVATTPLRTPRQAELPPAFSSPRSLRTRRDGSTYIMPKKEQERQERVSQVRRGSILSSMSQFLDEEEDDTGKKRVSTEGKVEVNASGKARIVFELGDVPQELLNAGNGARIPIGSIPISMRG